MKSLLKSAVKPTKSEMINLKLTRNERRMIQARADKYTGGNVSEWIRYAAINLEPRIQDLVNVK